MHTEAFVSTHSQQGRRPPVVWVAGVGMFLSTLDTGIMNVALPTLGQTFHARPSFAALTVTLYTLAITASVLWFGKVADQRGRLLVYAGGLMVFGAASVLCGIATSLTMLIVCRVIQGLGAAMLQATAASLITTFLPQTDQSKGFATLSVWIGIGPVVGPALGGLILSVLRWRWMFWVNIPFVALGLTGCRAMMLYTRGQNVTCGNHRSARKEPRTENYTWFIRSPKVLAATFGVFALGMATAIGFLVPPYALSQTYAASALQLGVVNLMAPAGLTISARGLGRMLSRCTVHTTMILGCVLMALADFLLAVTNIHAGLVVTAVLLFVYGVGAGAFVPAQMTYVMTMSPVRFQGRVGALQRMVQNAGIAAGTAIASNLITALPARHAPLFSGIVCSWGIGVVFLMCAMAYIHRVSRK